MSMMEEEKVAQALFDYFGEGEFSTRDIPEEVMERLTGLMEIPEPNPTRNIKVGQYISDIRGLVCTIGSGRRVKITASGPENRRPRRFRLVNCTPAPPKYKVSVKEDPDTMLDYDVVLVESEESWGVFCPALRGCVSQGDTEEEALENIREAMTGWLKLKARDVELEILNLLDEYDESGYPAKRAKVKVARLKADATVH